MSSVEGIADEIVIVDTGSTDKTKEIAAQFGAIVTDFEWIDDFAAARNYAFSQATQEYILWLDADDMIKEKDRLLFKELKRTLASDVQSVTMAYHLAFDGEGNVTSSLRRNRLVRRDCQFQWIGPVHEYLAVGGTLSIVMCVLHTRKIKNIRIGIYKYIVNVWSKENNSRHGICIISPTSFEITAYSKMRPTIMRSFWRLGRDGLRIIFRLV
ncbi:glycosyltransferase involved in cell wall biosynthesis [Paenibacillus sp. DS2015]